MRHFLLGLIGRLSVGRKLILIYALDLSAVIFISTILINEKFIAIDFARKEIVGNAYIAAVRAATLGAATDASGVPAAAAAHKQLLHRQSECPSRPARRLGYAGSERGGQSLQGRFHKRNGNNP